MGSVPQLSQQAEQLEAGLQTYNQLSIEAVAMLGSLEAKLQALNKLTQVSRTHCGMQHLDHAICKILGSSLKASSFK